MEHSSTGVVSWPEAVLQNGLLQQSLGAQYTCNLGLHCCSKRELFTHSGSRAGLFTLKLTIHRQDLVKQVHINKHNKSSIHFNIKRLHNSLHILALTVDDESTTAARQGTHRSWKFQRKKSNVTICCWPRSYIYTIYLFVLIYFKDKSLRERLLHSQPRSMHRISLTP